MKIKIIPASEDNIHIADLYLTKLIHDEKKYDKNINDECNIVKYYENIYPSNAKLDTMYVEEKYRFGGKLIDEFESWAKRKEKCFFNKYKFMKVLYC